MRTFSKHLKFPSILANLSEVESTIDHMVADSIISESVYGNVIVAATEATLNAIMHGNHQEMNRLTSVNFLVSDEELCIVVEDEGEGFNFDSLPDPTSPENLEKVNGRGIFIIRSLCDKLEFERNGARLKMWFNLAGGHVAQA